MLNLQITKQTPRLFIFGWFAVLFAILYAGWTSTWQTLRIPTMSPPFADMRTVQGSLSSLDSGLNPQISNPGDPWNRRMNYPSSWSWIAKALGLQHESNFLIFVSATIAAFLLCCYFLLRQYPSITLLLMSFSNATLLAVERGNNDLVVFTLLFLAASSPVAVSMIAMFAATSLKIYPLLALPAFLGNPRHAAGMALLVIIAIAIVWPELSAIRSATPTSSSLSYGTPSIATGLLHKFGISLPHVVLTVALITASFTMLALSWVKARLATVDTNKHEKMLFLAGACIYVGTFILSSNWDYRLIFLLLCVPFLMKIKDIFVRFGLVISLLIALNFTPLVLALGSFGLAINMLSKVSLFVILTAMILIQIQASLFLKYPAACGGDKTMGVSKGGEA